MGTSAEQSLRIRATEREFAPQSLRFRSAGRGPIQQSLRLQGEVWSYLKSEAQSLKSRAYGLKLRL